MAEPNKTHLKISVNNQPLKVELLTSASIIYLVGANAAGKSRFINGLRDSKAGIGITNANGKIRGIPYRYFDWAKFEYSEENSVKNNYRDINQTLDIFEQDLIQMKEEVIQGERKLIDGNWQRDNKIIEHPRLNDINFKGIAHLSEGTRKLYQTLNWNLRKALSTTKYPKSHETHQPSLFVIGIEEPEINLHPKIQKEIPAFLEDWIKKQIIHSGTPILIVVSTHSPFVIKGTQNFRKTQRIYGLEKCELVDLTGKKDPEIAKNGVSGSESIIVANKMLGAGIGDFFPNPILMAESSIITLLKRISKNLSYPFDEFIVNPQGDGDIEKRIGNMQQMIKMLKTMHNSFPDRELFEFKIVIIVDDIDSEQEMKKKFTNNNEGLIVEVYSIGDKQLEDVYPQNFIDEFISINYSKNKSWDKGNLINEYISKELGLNGKNKGLFKNALAEFVGGRISNIRELRVQIPSISDILSNIGID